MTAPASTPTADDAKAFATLQARAALAGVVLHRTTRDDGRPAYIVTRWALTRELGSLDEVGQWLDRVAGPAS